MPETPITPTPTKATYATVDQHEVPQNDPNARAGYTFDPFADPCQLADIHDPRFPFHNYRQIHVGEVSFFEARNAKTRADIPVCPPLWQDVRHYWDVMGEVGYLSTHPEDKSPMTGTSSLLKNEFTITGTGQVDWNSTLLKLVILIIGILGSPVVLKLLGNV